MSALIQKGKGGGARRGRGQAVKMLPLNGYVGYALRRAQGVIFADFNDALAELGLRPGHFAILTLIRQNPGVSQSSVCSALGIQKANFVATISELEKRGFVRRRKSAADARTYAMELTGAGQRVLKRAAALQSVHEARVTARLGTQGRVQLLKLLGKLSSLA
jgi:DNA-binding MarR family transcriptional regulator